MHTIDDIRRDDLILAALLLVIGVPRAILAVFYENTIPVDGVLSLACVGFALLILVRRHF